ncbi:H+/Cl- antiporter ClcA [Ornithinibacter aureus]|nr:H+/Cl- antiporter ClcA [Ornithinibacter aureus]
MSPNRTAEWGTGMRPPAIALLWGALAGGAAALVYTAMNAAQHVIWPDDIARWYIPLIVLAGGGLIALLRPHTDDGSLDDQLTAAADPRRLRRERTAALALSAIIAYGFGGAIGPEAGLIAVIAELSALVGVRITHSEQEARLIGQSGSAAALAGLYGSPPGAAAYDDDTLAPGKLLTLLAAGAGFLTFLVVHRAFGTDHTDLGIPTYTHSNGQLLAAIVPALAGAALGLLYTRLHAWTTALLTRVGSATRQTLIGSAALAALAAAFPVALFSGHDQLHKVHDLVADSAWLMLATAALVKVAATAITLSSGWRGGEFFPLLFAGAAAGALATAAIPNLDLATAEIAGLAAATTVGLKKPAAAVLICALLIGQAAWGPLIIGATIGLFAIRGGTTNPDHTAAT